MFKWLTVVHQLDQHRRIVILVCILLLAALLRLYRLDLIDYRYDEAIAPLLAMRIASGDLMSIAPFSGSVANHPPVYLYVLALPYLFTRDLMWITAYRALLDVLAIGLLWWVCSRFFNSRVAGVTSLLFAVAPWAIQFSRKLWLAPLPLFSVLLLWGVLEVIQRRNPKGWIITGVSLALCVGTHLSAIYMVPVVLLTIVLGIHTLRLKPVIIGLIPLIVIATVYVLHDATVGFSNINALLGAGLQTAEADLRSVEYALWSSGGAHISDLTAGAFPIWEAQLPAVFNVIDSLQQIGMIAGLIALIIVAVRGIQRRQWHEASVSLILIAFLCFPVVFQLRHSRPLQIHYLTPIYPAPFLVMGLLVNRILTYRTKWLAVTRGATIAVLAMIVGWHLVTTLRFTDFVARYDTSVGGYGLPVRSALDVAAYVKGLLCGSRRCADNADVIVVTPGGDPLVDEQATIWHTVLADVPHRFANSNAGIILRPGGAIYIFTPGTDHAMYELKSSTPPSEILYVFRPVRTGSALLYTIVRTNESQNSDFHADIAASWANGVVLAGYQTTQDKSLKLELLMKVIRTPVAGQDYHWFNHVISGTLKIAQADGGGVHPSNWREGDILLHWFDFPLPAPVISSELSIRIGSYQYPSLEGISVTLADGTITDAVSIPVK